jgi:hypothetical protein
MLQCTPTQHNNKGERKRRRKNTLETTRLSTCQSKLKVSYPEMGFYIHTIKKFVKVKKKSSLLLFENKLFYMGNGPKLLSVLLCM